MNKEILDELARQAGFNVDLLREPYPGGFPREDMLALESLVELVLQKILSQLEEDRKYYANPGKYQDSQYYVRMEAKADAIVQTISDIKYNFGIKK